MATKNSMTPSGGIFRSGAGSGLSHGILPSATTIQQQIQRDLQRQAEERWKILRETQSKIFELQQDITVHRARTADAARQALEKYLRQ